MLSRSHILFWSFLFNPYNFIIIPISQMMKLSPEGVKWPSQGHKVYQWQRFEPRWSSFTAFCLNSLTLKAFFKAGQWAERSRSSGICYIIPSSLKKYKLQSRLTPHQPIPCNRSWKKKANCALWPSGPEHRWGFQGRKDLKSKWEYPSSLPPPSSRLCQGSINRSLLVQMLEPWVDPGGTGAPASPAGAELAQNQDRVGVPE